MTISAYKRFSRVLRRSYPSIAATAALVVALAGVPGVTAGGLLVTSKQIKNGTITSKDIHRAGVKTTDIHKDAVRSADIQEGAVQSADIGEGQVTTGDIGAGQVTPTDVTMPGPEQIADDGHTADVGTTFALVDEAGSYAKEDPTSELKVEWIGTAEAGFSPCIFQIRVNGQPSSAGGGGEIYVQGSTWTGSTSALFTGVGAGPVKIEVWARVTIESNVNYPCTVGPANTIPQHFEVSEEVI